VELSLATMSPPALIEPALIEPALIEPVVMGLPGATTANYIDTIHRAVGRVTPRVATGLDVRCPSHQSLVPQSLG
jgi:hypothetical protein